MKLLLMAVCRSDYKLSSPVIIAKVSDLSDFSFFTRSKAQEGMIFLTRELVKKNLSGSKTSTCNEQYTAHIQVTFDGLAGVVIADLEYPERTAHGIVVKMLTEFRNKHGDRWANVEADDSLPLPWMDSALQRFQNPAEADKIEAVKQEIERVKDIVHQTIEAALGRDDQLNDLVAKSEDLSAQSKMFYKNSKKMKRCCIIQ
eukprot:60228_1